jgi:hypothetical protein
MNETRDWQAMKVMSARLLIERTGEDVAPGINASSKNPSTMNSSSAAG